MHSLSAYIMGMTTFDVRVHDLFNDGEEAETGRPLYSALIVAESRDRSIPLAFHTGLVTGQYLKDLRTLQATGAVVIEVEDGFFESDLYHQRKEVIRSAFAAAGIDMDS